MLKIKNICVYCGTCTGNGPVYAKTAIALGELLAARKIGLIYGGSYAGTMRILADTVLSAGGQVCGIIPKSFGAEAVHPKLTELVETNSIHERKRLMIERSDAIIAMPGGFGTLDEIMEALAWRQLNIHQSPCGFLNPNGFYDGLINFLEHTVTAGFLRTQHYRIIQTATNPEELLIKLENYEHIDDNRWRQDR